MTPDQEKEFEEIKKSIAGQLPFLARYFDYAETLEGHARTLREYRSDPIHVQRQSTLRTMVQRYIERVHGISVSVSSSLFVNIMDHHTMLNNLLSLATNIVANACDLVSGPKKPLVVFTTSIPSQENYFSDVRVIASGGLTKEYIQHLIAMPFHVLFAPALLEIYNIYLPVHLRANNSLTPADLFGSEFDWIS